MPHVVVWTLCRALIDILETLSNGRASQAFLSDGSRRIPYGKDWPAKMILIVTIYHFVRSTTTLNHGNQHTIGLCKLLSASGAGTRE